MTVRLRAPAFALGYLAAYFLSSVLPTPLLWYFPLERRFGWAVHPLAFGSDYFGRVALSLVAGGVIALLVPRTSSRPDAGRVLAAWIASLLVFAVGYFGFVLAHRGVAPLPLPEGYVPR